MKRHEREKGGFVGRIISLDKVWANLYESKTKRHAEEWHQYWSLRRQFVRQTPNNVRDMVIFVYDCQYVIVADPVPSGQTVNAQYYCSFLENNVRPALG